MWLTRKESQALITLADRGEKKVESSRWVSLPLWMAMKHEQHPSQFSLELHTGGNSVC